MVEFKIYDESRLDDHIKLVLEVIEDWNWKPYRKEEGFRHNQRDKPGHIQ